ncbi:MAG: ammonium transporter [Pseudomonadota bacterium]
MDEQTADLLARIEQLEASSQMLGTIDTEIFYFWTVAFMMIIHAGFLSYEMGASRAKNVLASGIKNILALAFVAPTFFLFGWWIYLAMPNGFIPISDGDAGLPWANAMGPNTADNATGVFWAAFTLFAATTASILSGSVIERIRTGAFVVLAILLGSVVWNLVGAWGWHPDGWLLTKWGFHDFAAAGVVHLVAASFTLGVLINLGPRVGRFDLAGQPVDLHAHNVPMVLIGLMLIIVGFFGFLAACVIMNAGDQWTNIYGQPMTLSSVAFNALMGFSGGVIGAWMFTRDPFWMMSGGLAGIITVAAGMDIWFPPLAFLLAFVGGATIKLIDSWLTRLGIDDAVGAVAVHGWCGILALLAVGVFGAGYANVADLPAVSLLGQIVGIFVCACAGFIPGFTISLIMKMMGALRVPDVAQDLGLDATKVPVPAYPERAIY